MNAKVKTRNQIAATNARNLRTLLLLSVFEPEDIGARIAAARKEAGLTQEEIGDLVGVSTRSFQGYESGAVIPYRHMAKIAEVTRRPIEWLLYGDPEEKAPDVADLAVLAQLDRIERVLEVLVARSEPDDEQEDPAEDSP